MSPYSDHGAAGDLRSFGNDYDSIPDVIVVVVLILQIVGVDDGDIVADPGVLVDDGLDDSAVIADPHAGNALGFVLFQFVGGLEPIGAHQDGVLDGGARADPASHADDGMAHVRAVEDASVRDDRMMDGAIVQFGCSANCGHACR